MAYNNAIVLTLIFILVGLAMIFLGGVVYYSDPHKDTNRWLSLFIGSGIIWLVTNLLANNSTDSYNFLMFSRFATFGAAILPLAFVMFCLSYVAESKKGGRAGGKILPHLLALPVMVILVMVPTSFNVRSASAASDSITPGPIYYLLLAVFVTYFSAGILILINEYKIARPIQRQQLYYILLGTLLTTIPGLFFSGVLPLFGESKPAIYSPVVVIFFIAFTTLAIVKHRLFDIRFAIARAVAYLGSVVVLALVYSFVFFLVLNNVVGLDITRGIKVLLAVSTGIAGLFFPLIRKQFDKLTNTYFYRDAYDPQKLFGDLNKVLVSSLDTRYLMMQSISVIETALKPDFAAVGFAGAANQYRLFASRKLDFSDETVAYVRKSTPHIHHKVIVVDYLDDTTHAELKKVLASIDVAVLVRLTQDVHHTQEGMGYLILGNKKSGNPYTPQDVLTLETVANELIIAVQNALHYEEIQNFNATLQQKVEDATRQLKRTNAKLEALDETKDDFISMASHQLRTPLTSVKGYLSMVLEGDAGSLNETQRKMLSQAFISSQRMVFLIADLLNVSRLKTGKFVIDWSPVNLSTMIEEEMSQLVDTAESREIKLSYKKPANFPVLNMDETKIRQVIMNFMDNAIYYTPPGGTIVVSLEEKPAAIELRVTDNGIGVPVSEQHHLFTKFYRARNAQKARPDGTGLGLFMAKKVITAQGGAIIFESKEGKGSTFGFTFSKSKLAMPHEAPKTGVAEAKIESKE